MLLELSISDFAIIERTTIRFTEGLNALTGETGAGKSILLDAMGAVLGARVNADLVRSGAKLARVEAAFSPDAATSSRLADSLDAIGVDLAAEEALILTREILSGGRSSARINGRLTTAGTLAQIGSLLVDIHGQSDHLAILKTAEQRNLLDRFAMVESGRSDLGQVVREWRELRHRIADLARDSRDREQRIDLSRFQVDEIDAAQLQDGEDATLGAERDILRNADRLRDDALEALAFLAEEDVAEGGAAAIPLLRGLGARTADIADLDVSSANLAERATELLVLAEDLARELRAYAEGVESDEQRLLEIEDRIALIQSLKRKYGASISEILDFGESVRRELGHLQSGDYDISMLEERETTIGRSVADYARALSEQRQSAANRLAEAIERSIAELNMGSAQIEIAVRQREDPTGIPIDGPDGIRMVHVDEFGIDDIEFMLAPNAGETLKPLNRIASGGETARLMLATKSILSQVDLTPTLVFDEIDVGVGGRSGQVVGEKLWAIAGNHQVIVVTHLPQIAAFAESHHKIEKHDTSGRTISDVRTLDAEDREIELAAMLDGLPVTEAARASAREMVARARSFVLAASASRAG